MSGQSLVAREAEVLKTLQTIRQSGEKFTLVGGYAINAYSTLPRYSVDCDLVVTRSQHKRLSLILDDQGYTDEGAAYLNGIEGLETRKFVKKVGGEKVSVDLLVDGVRCRQTEAVWKEVECAKTSRELRVTGVNGSVLSNVASRDLLISMKLHSGRDTDLRDIVMLARDSDWGKVKELSNRGVHEKLTDQLNKEIAILSDGQFESQLKAAFASKQSEAGRIVKALSEIRKLLNELQG
jgi:predicted nucleotidyltransferase